MGVMVNAASGAVVDFDNIVQGFGTPASMKIAENTTRNLVEKSRTCPIISECRDIGEGITLGEISSQATLSGGLLALYAMSLSSGISSGS